MSSRTGWEPNRVFAFGVNLKQLIEWAYQVTTFRELGTFARVESVQCP
jgi:hypothetical protein